jgi:hypothetical protein
LLAAFELLEFCEILAIWEYPPADDLLWLDFLVKDVPLTD